MAGAAGREVGGGLGILKPSFLTDHVCIREVPPLCAWLAWDGDKGTSMRQSPSVPSRSSEGRGRVWESGKRETA